MNVHVAPDRRLVIPSVYHTLTWSELGGVVQKSVFSKGFCIHTPWGVCEKMGGACMCAFHMRALRGAAPR